MEDTFQMKNIFRALVLGILMSVFAAATATSTFAQDADAEKAALYEKYTKNYNSKDIEKVKIAIAAAKEYIAKFGANEADKEQVDYYKAALPPLEDTVRKAGEAAQFDAVVNRFDSSYPAGRYDETYASGKELLAKNPQLLDVMIVLGSIGYDESLKNPANTKYNADTINYAKTAIQKIESGQTSKNYGAFGVYTYGDFPRSEANKNDKFPGRDNALGNLNFKIGYLMYFSQNMKKEAIPYFYKASKYDSSVKNLPAIYQIIGDSYFEEAKRLNKESEDLAKAAGDKDTDESKAKDGLAKGYADRAIDAYARAYKLATANQAVKKEYKDGLYKLLQELFKFRFSGKIDGLDAYVATVMSKPFVDPSTAVTPVIEATPATTSSSLSATSNTTVAASSEAPKTVSVKSVSSTTAATKATPVKAVVKTKAPAKKPVTKKKGTR